MFARGTFDAGCLFVCLSRIDIVTCFTVRALDQQHVIIPPISACVASKNDIAAVVQNDLFFIKDFNNGFSYSRSSGMTANTSISKSMSGVASPATTRPVETG